MEDDGMVILAADWVRARIDRRVALNRRLRALGELPAHRHLIRRHTSREQSVPAIRERHGRGA